MKVTRILYSNNLNQGKFAKLQKQARLLGRVRSEVWQRFGSVSGVHLRDRQIRDQWMKEGRDFSVSANAWKETLRDCMTDIKAYREAAKEKVKTAIRNRSDDKEELKRLYTLLKSDKWQDDPFLRRQMRKHFKHGVSHTDNQIVIRSDMCKTFELNGQCWLKVPSLRPRKTIHIPLNTTMEYAPTGTLRLILRQNKVEVHYQQEVDVTVTAGEQVVGIDKGYTEAFVDSDNDRYGEGLGSLIANESDYLNRKYRHRNKLRAIARKKPHKQAAIEANNLCRKKLDKRQDRQVAMLRTLIFTATHKLVDKAGLIVAEDLSSPIASQKSYGKNTNRRLNQWTKGILAEALETVSQRRCSSLHLVNAAYTSQMDSLCHGLLLGTRRGDKFYRYTGEVVQADFNAAQNVLSRLYDHEIDRWTHFKRVKSILLERTEGYLAKAKENKSELTDLGSSYTLGNRTLTECKLIT